MVKISCIKCHQITDVDCATCETWDCTNCGNRNAITVEHASTVGGWLDENGICRFPSSIERMPNGVWIASGFTDILELVVGLVWNKPGPGFGIYDWDKDQPIPANVLERIMGVQMDVEVIDWIQADNGGRGILIGESSGDIQDMGLTPDEWMKKYGTNGMAALAKQRLFWFAKGGGVQPAYKANKKYGVETDPQPGSGELRMNPKPGAPKAVPLGKVAQRLANEAEEGKK